MGWFLMVRCEHCGTHVPLGNIFCAPSCRDEWLEEIALDEVQEFYQDNERMLEFL